MDTPATTERDPDAFRLAEEMVRRRDILETIVMETIDSAATGDIREAGRTKCPTGDRIRGPLGRFEKAINLHQCPGGAGGVWHTHITPDEIRRPENSLPDMANVIYGLTNVSIVVGTETADVMVAAKDPMAARDEFENALGVRLGGPEALVEELSSGRLAPTSSRRRVRANMDDLFYTRETDLEESQRKLRSIQPEQWGDPRGTGRDERFSGNVPGIPPVQTKNIEEAASVMTRQLAGVGLGQLVLSTSIGTVVGEVVNRVLLGED